MHIMLVSPLYSTHFDSGWFWLRALGQMGHSVQVWDYRLDVDPPPFFSYPEVTLALKGESVNPRNLPRPCFNYWPDALERTPGIEEVLQHYDKVFTPVVPTPDWMEWLPTGYDEKIHRDLHLERDVDTIYVGTANSKYKVETIEKICPEAVYGNEWRDWYPPVYLHDLVRVLNRGKILIDVHQSPTVGLNRKLFEMIACGFTITDGVPGVQEILGKELASKVTFKDPHEAKELIRYFLEKPEEREDLWKVERKAIRNFTYLRATEKLLNSLKL